jgi:hypothetical protein
MGGWFIHSPFKSLKGSGWSLGLVPHFNTSMLLVYQKALELDLYVYWNYDTSICCLDCETFIRGSFCVFGESSP